MDNSSNGLNMKIVMAVLLIALMSISLRTDFSNEYPKGVDTYPLAYTAKTIQSDKYIIWNMNPFSIIGVYSLSYPVGGSLLLAQMSLLMGTSLLTTIWIWNLFFIIVAAILTYLICNAVFKNKLISILSALIYLNSRMFIGYSTFYTSRNVFHLFFLTIMLFMLKSVTEKKNIYFAIFLSILSALIHRSFILLPVFIIIYYVSVYAYKHYKDSTYYKLGILGVGLVLFLISAWLFGDTNIGTETTRIPIKLGMTYLDNILQALFAISMHFGILIIFWPLGYFILLNKKNKSQIEFFILILLTLSIPFIFDTIYFYYFLLPIIVLTIMFFIQYLLKIASQHVKYAMIIFIIIALIIPLYITILSPSSDYIYVRERTVSVAQFTDSQYFKGRIVCNYHFPYCAQISVLNHKDIVYNPSITNIQDYNFSEEEIVSLDRIRNKFILKDKILGIEIFTDTYTLVAINWYVPYNKLNQILNVTKIKYILDSQNPDSNFNRNKIIQKYGEMNQIYDNGLQQIKVIT